VFNKCLNILVGINFQWIIFAKNNMIGKRIFLIVIVLSGFINNLEALPVRVYGNAQEYKSSTLIFNKYSDRITYLREKVFELNIDEEGNFDTTFDIDEITYVFSEFGVYFAYFYAEPGYEYELVLPPYEEKELADLFNPFFSPQETHLGIKNMKETDLNYLIMDFDYYYFRYLEMNYLDVYAQGIKSDVDTFITELNKRYKIYDNKYFQDYRKYRIAALKNIATQKQLEDVLVFANYSKSPVLYDNPAYMDLFNNIFYNFFDKILTSKDGGILYAIIHYGHSITRLKKFLNAKYYYLRNTQFQELVILKGLNDAFSNKDLAWLPLLLTLDSLFLSTEYPIHQRIAQNIADNTLSMAKGTIAPPFELTDTSGNTVKLSDCRGNYVYLCFANTQSYTCQTEFLMMKKIYEKYKGLCIFVTILTDEDRKKALDFIYKNQLTWDFLFTEINSSTISTYKVTSFPTCFLIDPVGTLVLSPATLPSENIENYLFKIFQPKTKN